MKWKFSMPETPMLVYYCVKLTGLAPFTIRKGRFYPPTLLGKVYSVSLAGVYFFVLQIALTPIIREVGPGTFSPLANIGIILRHFMNIASTFLTLITFLLMYKKILYIMNKLCDIGDELNKLEIEEDRGLFFKNVGVTTLMANTVLVSACGMLNFTLPRMTTILLIKYTIDMGFKLNMVLTFAQILLFIRRRFKLINEKFYEVLRPAGHRRSLNRLQMFVVRRNPREESRPGIENLTDLQCIQKIELSHFELCDLVHQTTNLFAIPILLSSLQNSIELIVSFFRIYFVFQNSASQLHSVAEIVAVLKHITSPLLKIVIVIAQLFPIAYASATTCKEGKATNVVLSKVWRKPKSQDLEDEFFLFSLQLMHKPVTVSAFGFFKLDYSYLYKIFCAVVAYLVIMIQFHTSQIDTST